MATAVEAAQAERSTSTDKTDVERRGSVARTEKGRWERLWPVIACGAGLFSDGYLNNVRNSPSATMYTPCDTLLYPERHTSQSDLSRC